MRTKVDNFDWDLATVYGAAQHVHKPRFLSELVRICGDEKLHILVGVTLTSSVEKIKTIMTTLMVDGHSF